VGHLTHVRGERAATLSAAPPQDLQKADEKWIGRNLDSASMSARRPSLLIDLLADYGDSALIDAGSIPTLNR
jgi:hypothetical protein